MRRFLRLSSSALAFCFLSLQLFAAETTKDKAWSVLYSGLRENSVDKRTTAVQVLGLLPGDPKAEEAALKALSDEKPEVRAAAAKALGDMKAKNAIPRLMGMYNDKDPGVIMASGKALIVLGDERGYNVYYAILTGERKSGTSLMDEQKKMLNDPKKMAQFGFEQGIGFIPFAGMGYGAFKMLTKDNTSPVLAAAALTLAKDPDPKSGQALADTAANNKSWIVRAAALNALALRGETSLLPSAEAQMGDPKEEVRYSAAAAVIRLTDLKQRPAPAHRAPVKPAPKKK
ncbi:MAG TPA: HEAT repeat domain-containing protein [Candidatus Binatia bacterium]|jgi:HEAT repeat protein|nr:HEAT repeat domain-containing protein [Candidatus Binatia bacterium]